MTPMARALRLALAVVAPLALVGALSSCGDTIGVARPTVISGSAVFQVAPPPTGPALPSPPAPAPSMRTQASVSAVVGAAAPTASAAANPATAVAVDQASAGAWTPWKECPASGRAAVIDRKKQRVWLCRDGARSAEMPTTGAIIQPDPGLYKVYYRALRSSSTIGGHYSTMTHFVAFDRGKRSGARIAFHSMPKLRNGQFVQPLATLGDPRKRGLSAGCLRMSPDDAVKIWNFLQLGDVVRVLN